MSDTAEGTDPSGPQAPEAIASPEASFRAIFHDAAIGIAVVDMEGHPVRANPALERILGYSAAELQRMVFTEFTHPEDATADWTMFQDLVAGNRDHFQLEKRYFRKDGALIWGQLTVSLIRDEEGRPAYAIAMVTDITERKEAQEAIHKSEAKYRRLVERVPAIVYEVAGDEINTAHYMSPHYETLLGYTPEERLADAELWTKMIHPEDRERVLAASNRCRETGEPFAEEYRLLAKDGRIVWVRDDGVLAQDDLGRPIQQGVMLEITELKRMEHNLVEAESRYRTLVEQIPAVTYIWDERQGSDHPELPYVSPQIEAMLGFSPEEFMADAKLWFRRVHPDDRQSVMTEAARTAQAGEHFGMEYRMLSRDERVVWVRDEAAVLVREGARVLLYQGVLLDITERKRMEGELLTRWEEQQKTNAERKRMLARLVVAQEDERRRIASNIHDDPVQKMTAVGLRLDMLAAERPDLAEDPMFTRLMDTVRDSVGSLRHMMFEVRPYSLDGDGLESALRTLVHQEATMDPTAEYGVDWKIRRSIPPEVASGLYRIAEEAIRNARTHAKASVVTLDATEAADRAIALRVRDDGVGLSQEKQTESPPGHLGLTAMRERAELAGGTFAITSRPGAGTTIEVYLPFDGISEVA
jgi:PAS domain S-box-containing protein